MGATVQYRRRDEMFVLTMGEVWNADLHDVVVPCSLNKFLLVKSVGGSSMIVMATRLSAFAFLITCSPTQ
jgi:hypothetical protein